VRDGATIVKKHAEKEEPVEQDGSELRACIATAEKLATEQNWDDRSIRVNERILELDNKNIPARTRLAKYHLNAGNWDEAGRLYEETLHLAPDNVIAQNGMERLIREAGSDADTEDRDESHDQPTHRRTLGPRRYPKSEDIEMARTYFETLYPDEQNRRLALDKMVETLWQIDRANILALGLTVRPTWSRLNVGSMGWGFFGPTEIGLIVPGHALHALSTEQTDRVRPVPAGYAALRSLPSQGFQYVSVPLDGLDDIYPLLRESHFWVVRELAKRVSRTPYYKYHSSGATAYMQEFLGKDVPDPEH
jgi:tetratricopeptide (TPR) repeat protein